MKNTRNFDTYITKCLNSTYWEGENNGPHIFLNVHSLYLCTRKKKQAIKASVKHAGVGFGPYPVNSCFALVSVVCVQQCKKRSLNSLAYIVLSVQVIMLMLFARRV